MITNLTKFYIRSPEKPNHFYWYYAAISYQKDGSPIGISCFASHTKILKRAERRFVNRHIRWVSKSLNKN